MKKITLVLEDDEALGLKAVCAACKRIFGWKRVEFDEGNGTVAFKDKDGTWLCVEDLNDGIAYDEDGEARYVVPFGLAAMSASLTRWAQDDAGRWTLLAFGRN